MEENEKSGLTGCVQMLDHVIGAVSLHENEELKPDLTPWLESLVVDKAYQNQGVGKLLVEKIKQKARDLHFKKLYLFAFAPTLPVYYARFGFNKISEDKFKGHPVTVMEIALWAPICADKNETAYSINFLGDNVHE